MEENTTSLVTYLRHHGSDDTGSCPSSPNGAHFWVISAHRTETSAGVCRYCKAEREFANDKRMAFSQYGMVTTGGIPNKE